MTNLSDIIERLEKAEAGSHKLDEAIALSVVGMTKKNRLAEFPSHDPVWEFTDGRTSGSSHALVPRYTTSVDAAISLAGKITPNMDWLVRNDEAGAFVNLSSVRDGGEWIEGVNSFPTWASTAPIALCLAILKAKAQQQEGGE